MQKAKEYFDKEYGTDHIKEVVEMGDIVSIYGLMEEYAEKCSLLHSSELLCGGCKKTLHDGLCGSCCTDLAGGNF
jgi:hypothetical protein